MVVHLVSPDERYDVLYLSQLRDAAGSRDELARLDGRRQRRRCSARGDYCDARLARPAESRRAEPHRRRRRRGHPRAERPGRRRRRRAARRHRRRSSSSRSTRRAASPTRRSSGASSSRPATPAQIMRLKRRRPHRARREQLLAPLLLNNKPAVGIGIFQLPGSNALRHLRRRRATMAELKAELPGRASTSASSTTRRSSSATRSRTSSRRCSRRSLLVVAGRRAVPADLARVAHPAGRRARVARRHVRRDATVRVLAQHALAVRRSCSRSASSSTTRSSSSRTSSATSREGLTPLEATQQAMRRGHRPDHRHRARAVRGVHPHRVHQRPHRPVLPAVRADDRHLARSSRRSTRSRCRRRWRALLLKRTARARTGSARASTVPSAGSSARSTASSSVPRERYTAAAARRPRAPARSRSSSTRACSSLTWFGFPQVPAGFMPHAGQAVPDRLCAAARRGDARPHRRGDPRMADIGSSSRAWRTRSRSPVCPSTGS